MRLIFFFSAEEGGGPAERWCFDLHESFDPRRYYFGKGEETPAHNNCAGANPFVSLQAPDLLNMDWSYAFRTPTKQIDSEHRCAT